MPRTKFSIRIKWAVVQIITVEILEFRGERKWHKESENAR